MNKSTIGFKIRNTDVAMKDVCFGCGYVNPKATAFYKCHVTGSCPAIAVKSDKKPEATRLSYPIGTEVLVTNKRRCPSGKNIITDVSTSRGRLCYAVSGCAWYEYDELTFVADPTPDSLQEAIILGDRSGGDGA